ncbi:MAG: amidase [Acidobacteria bacterium]|nr:amidase [Acidobacteriota bacterium]
MILTTFVPAARMRLRYFTMAVVAIVAAAFPPAPAAQGPGAAARAAAPAVPFRLMEATIRETQAALTAGTITSEQLAQMYLARIEAYDKRGPAINAVIRLNPNAVAEARALDTERRARGPRGPLHGIPLLLKDNFDTADMPTAAASISLATSIPPDDAFMVRRLRDAGALFLGKTNMSEFAWTLTTGSSLGGQTLNPYDLTRNPGGSSGGTGAAIAANFAVFGTGTDTCGSIRIPASHNSLVGLRATQGLLSRDGIVPLALSQDMGGPMARSVEDIAIALDGVAGVDPHDPATIASAAHTPATYTAFLKTGRLRGARIGLLLDAVVPDQTDPDVAGVVASAEAELRRLGAEVVKVTIPDYAVISNFSLITREFKANLEAYLRATPAAPAKTLQAILDTGTVHPGARSLFDQALQFPSTDTGDYRQRVAASAVFRSAIVNALDDNRLDALLYPTMRQKPVAVPLTSQPGSNCRVSAHSGLPAISVPAGFTPDGIPVGIEFLGREYSEGDLLALAYSWEQATHHRRPPVTTPDLDVDWSYAIADGAANVRIDPDGRRFRLTVPDADTHVYLDPSMRIEEGVVRGEFEDDRWRVGYEIPIARSAGGGGTRRADTATVRAVDLQSGRAYELHGTAVPQ